MKEYHKIQSVFMRDPATNHKTFLMGEWSLPEFDFLQNCQWVFTEKVDGTNIRVIYEPDSGIYFKGKTDNAQLPTQLFDALNEMFPLDRMADAFTAPVCLYGEGYGAKIQKGGGNYRPDQSFVLFDVRVGDWWLQREAVEGIASKLGISIVPIIGKGTLHDAIRRTETGFMSTWGSFIAEGIVARPAVELTARNGSRIITKVKHKDFTKS